MKKEEERKMEISLEELSPVLKRLIEEVRNEENMTDSKDWVPTVYSRFHNRHNRSR